MRVLAVATFLSFSLAIFAAPVPDAEVCYPTVSYPGLRSHQYRHLSKISRLLAHFIDEMQSP